MQSLYLSCGGSKVANLFLEIAQSTIESAIEMHVPPTEVIISKSIG